MNVDGVGLSQGVRTPSGSATPEVRRDRPDLEARRSTVLADTTAPAPVDLPVTTSPRFYVDRESKRVTIVVVDEESGKVVRQVPPEEILELARMAARRLGSLFDTQG
ncbi:MAG: flagellar protein FlaG [Actinobacteria bacterium]|nr:flagellar protein FlaG [Actinomycetota bacterium]